MAIPDPLNPSLRSPLLPDEPKRAALHAEGTLPPRERNEDPERSALTNDMSDGPSRPLTHDEQEAAEHDTALPERVYAPASERVPKPPAPGHEPLVRATDPSTPERQSAGTAGAFQEGAQGASPSGPSRSAAATLPPPRPWTPPPAALGYHDERSRKPLVFGLSAGSAAVIGASVGGAWWYTRWRREQHRPINRVRRQLRRTASAMGDRLPTLPSRDDVLDRLPDADRARPAGGAGLTLLLAALWAARVLRNRDRQLEPDRRDRDVVVTRTTVKTTVDAQREPVGRPWQTRATDLAGNLAGAWRQWAAPVRENVQVAPERALATARERASAVPAPPKGASLGLGGVLLLAGVGYVLWRLMRGAGEPEVRWSAEPGTGYRRASPGSAPGAERSPGTGSSAP